MKAAVRRGAAWGVAVGAVSTDRYGLGRILGAFEGASRRAKTAALRRPADSCLTSLTHSVEQTDVQRLLLANVSCREERPSKILARVSPERGTDPLDSISSFSLSAEYINEE
jgi:hypothetical protein